MKSKKALYIFGGVFLILMILMLVILVLKPKPQVINTYDSDLVEMSIGYKEGIYTVDIEKYNKHFTVKEKDTKIIVHYEDKAIVEEYDNGLVKIYFYMELENDK